MSCQYEVAIVGAGPVGLVAACLLGQYGIRCIVLEKKVDVRSHPRAQTIDDESLRTLQSFGFASAFLPRTLEAQGSNYYDEFRNVFAKVGPGPKNYGYAKRNYILQQELDAGLHAYLARFSTVDIQFGAHVSRVYQDVDKASLQVSTRRKPLTANYVLACDGGQSSIRKSLGIEMRGWTYAQDWIVLDAVDDPDLEPVSHFFCDPHRPAVSIASPRGGRRYEFMLRPGENREEVLHDHFLAELLKPFRKWQPEKLTRRAVYTFHARIAERLRQNRVLLLGDAAHLTPPFAGQGMNAGIRDAHNVAWKLAGVLRNGFSPTVLDSYDSERREPIWTMIQLAVAMGEFVMPIEDEQIALKTSIMKSLERFPGVREWLFEMRFKPRPRYDNGLFVDLHDQAFEASLTGEMLPQPQVINKLDERLLLDDVLGSGFALISQDDAGHEALAKCQHRAFERLEPARIHIDAESGQSSQTDDLTVALATDDEYGRPIRTHRDQIILIRPDRYVAGACFPHQLNHFLNRFLLDSCGVPAN